MKRIFPGVPRLVDPSMPSAATRPMSAFLLCREDFTIVYVSDLLQVLLRMPDRRTGGESRDIFHLLGSSGMLDSAAVELALEPLRRAGLHSRIVHLKTEAGEHPLEVHVKPAGDGQWMLSFEDIQADGERRDELLALALTDPLVGISNRRCYQETVKRSLADGVAGTALLLDLDRFKAVNDTLGHPVGDQLLRKVGERLRTVMGGNHLLARLGGDEFAVWTDCIDACAMERMAAKIVEMLGRPFLIEGQQVNIGVSVGIAYAAAGVTTYERLMKCADLALYAAKGAGRNCVRCFLPLMEEAAQSRRKLEIELRKALTLRQMELHYRPSIDFESGAPMGVEAVLRWRHPEHGLMEPASFMGLADEIGLSLTIGKWMLKAACHDGAALGHIPRISMRMMPLQFTGREPLAELVRLAINTSGIRAPRLELKVTEDMLLHREEHVLQTLHQLRALGVSIGMDEFGTGYASLSKLVSFPFDRIRIAPSLVRDAAPNPTHRAIIQAVAMLGSSLGITTMIDGIHTPDQLKHIRAEGGAKVLACRLDDALPLQQLSSLFQNTVAA